MVVGSGENSLPSGSQAAPPAEPVEVPPPTHFAKTLLPAGVFYPCWGRESPVPLSPGGMGQLSLLQ